MDEVDIEDMEDLEARLYAQIHHEAVGDAVEPQKIPGEEPLNNEQLEPTIVERQRIVTATSVVNREAGTSRVPANRYWCAGQARNSNVTKQLVANPTVPEPKKTATVSIENFESENTLKATSIAQKKQPTFQSPLPKDPNILSIQLNEPKDNAEPKQNPPKQSKSKDLRVNPFAAATRTKQQKVGKNQRKKDPPSPPNILKNGPFAMQVQKLQKAMRIEAKMQKSQKVRAKKRNKNTIETIVLPSSDEEESDDVILVPVQPPPTFIVEDSDEEKPVLELPIEENAVDNCFFAKPQSTTLDLTEKRADNSSSRCTSPCSVLSSDDFIGQSDRCRLLEGSGMADDEDLLILTADVDSVMEAPPVPLPVTAVKHGSETRVLRALDDSSNEVECTDFVTPIGNLINNYRVEQTQFRALDVYESESDITDSIYSKGAARPKPTVIRAISSNSNDDDNVEDIGQKTKRLRKRRASSSNKESETNNEDDSTDSENEGTEITCVPGISRGVAVERCRSKPRKGSLSSCSGRASVGGAAGSVGNMSDSEFIATLNTLAQGGNEQSGDDKDDDSDDLQNTPTARDIAEKVLKRISQTLNTTAGVVTESNISDDNEEPMSDDVESRSASVIEIPPVIVDLPSASGEAIPMPSGDALATIGHVFETIDMLSKPKARVAPDTPIDVSDDAEAGSDPDIEVITPVVASLSRAPKPKHEKADPGDPVYHVIFSRGSRLQGGIGWNDEMRRFYNNSWNGEHFTLEATWQTMNANRSLWKIYTEDRFPKSRRFSNLKCHNCCEFGHTRAKCKRPKKPLLCYMCGECGHHEPRCPNTVCLRCGNKTHGFTKSCNACTFQNRLICPICKVRGHTLNFCPDKWRRYHSTTEPNNYPNDNVEYKKRKFCCVCGARGHLSENCRSAVRFMEYPTIVSDIKSHQKSYNDQTLRVHQTGIGFNLLYKPSEDYSFELAENTKSTNYYGRFLKAVGMGYLLKRKRKLSAMTSASTSSKQAKKHSKQQYVPNPYSKVAQEARNTKDVPEQVQEISESGNLECNAEVISIISNEQVVPPAVVEIIEEAADNAEVSTAADSDVNIDSPANESSQEFAVIDEVKCDDNEVHILDQPELNEEESNNFKLPAELTSTIQPQSPPEKEIPLHMDSDSNYSFSEHFELPTSTVEVVPVTSAAAEIPPKQPETVTSHKVITMPQRAKPREMDPLPDFIPLTETVDINDDDGNDDHDIDMQAGISRRYVTADSDEDGSGTQSPLPDLPCEAKVYLTHFHSKYLLSPVGHAFLEEKSKNFDLKARLDWTSVGHVLIIYGLHSNQDRFHRELLLKYRQLADQMNRKRLESSIKVPRRADVLIRFLRENINQLLSNLGNVNEILKRLKNLENQHSKNGFKLAEKTRRTLNMILLGQAGLRDGNLHLDKLLLNLKTLINDYKSDDLAPNELRDEIDAHWKVIFTAYRHDNYPELVKNYNKLISKSRIPKLNIDPALLGNKVLDTTLTNEQKERLEQLPQQLKQTAPTTVAKQSFVPNPLNPKNSKIMHKKLTTAQNTLALLQSPPPPAPSMKIKVVSASPTKAPPAPSMKTKTNQATTSTSATVGKTKANSTITQTTNKQQQATPPFANPEQRSTVATKIKEVAKKWESTCNTLLTEIDTPQKKGLVRDCKAPSMFWSRESMKYLDECLKLAESNTGLLEKLNRVQNKSQSGSLSYNDYRAVIKLHSAMLGQ